jgi:mono/diheme cytochrome c family protein
MEEKAMRAARILVLFTLLLTVACGPASSSTDPDQIGTLAPVPAEYAGMKNPLGPAGAVEGADVFQTNCGTCHGPGGHGDGPAAGSLDPKPKNLALLQESAEDDYLFWRISDGKPGTSMLAWKNILTEEQIWQTVSYIRSLE